MKTLVKYVLLDLFRNRILIIYTIILAILSVSVLSLDNNPTKGILSLLNISLLFIPVITILFATIYFYNSTEFTELLLSQPVKRKTVIISEYIGVATALSIAFLAGIGIPLLLIMPGSTSLTLLVTGELLTLIFCGLALLIFVKTRDKTKGIGVAIITSLFFSLLFDGLLIGFIYSFSDYPIDKVILGMIAFNPVDLARILMILRLDVSVMMGYSGALFKEFLGSSAGSAYAFGFLIAWVVLPVLLAVKSFRKKEF